MKKYKLCCIGHITQDKVVTPNNVVEMPGGTAYYFAKALSRLDVSEFQLVTAVGDEGMTAVEDIRQTGIAVECHLCEHSVCFENIYHSINQSNRTQRVTAMAAPFTLEMLKDVDAEIIHLGSLLQTDFSLEVIQALAS